MMPVTLDFAPRLLPSPQAAHYLGVSESTLRSLPIPRRILGGKKLYDRLDLDAYASGLPVEGGDSDQKSGESACDAAFGMVS